MLSLLDPFYAEIGLHTVAFVERMRGLSRCIYNLSGMRFYCLGVENYRDEKKEAILLNCIS